MWVENMYRLFGMYIYSLNKMCGNQVKRSFHISAIGEFSNIRPLEGTTNYSIIYNISNTCFSNK